MLESDIFAEYTEVTLRHTKKYVMHSGKLEQQHCEGINLTFFSIATNAEKSL